MLKDFQVELELSPKDNRVIQTGATYWSHDVNTAKINIKLLRHSEPVVLNKDVTVRVMMLFDDENKSEHIYTAKIEDEKAGIVSVILDKNVRSYVGQVICGVYADYGSEQKTDNGYFTFAMKRSLIDKRMPEMKQYYVSDFEDTLAKMKLANAEFAEVETKLNGRIDKIEKDISSNDVAKLSRVVNLEKKFSDFKIGGRNYFSKDIHDYDRSKTYANKKLPPGEKTFKILKRVGIENIPENRIFIGFSKKGAPGETAVETLWGIRDGVHEKEQITVKDMDYLSIFPKTQESLDFLDKYYEIQFECGNIATDFTLALEDLATRKDVRYIQKQIDELKKAITTLGGTL